MSAELLVLVIGIPAWAALVLGALYLDAKLGGWWSLAERYPCPPKEPQGGKTWRGESAWLGNGSSGVGGVLTVTANQLGLTLQMPLMLRLLYPDLFLPWKDVSVVRERGWLWDKVHLTFSAVPDVPVTILGPLADKILASVGPVWLDKKHPARQYC